MQPFSTNRTCGIGSLSRAPTQDVWLDGARGGGGGGTENDGEESHQSRLELRTRGNRDHQACVHGPWLWKPQRRRAHGGVRCAAGQSDPPIPEGSNFPSILVSPHLNRTLLPDGVWFVVSRRPRKGYTCCRLGAPGAHAKRVQQYSTS